jgi:hypothetical protein
MAAYFNVYSNICLTYILFYIPSFNYRLHYLTDVVLYNGTSGITPIDNILAADHYLPPFRNCIFGLNWYRIHPGWLNVSSTFELIYPGTRTYFVTEFSHTTSNETMFREIAFCLGTCPLGYYIIPNNTSYNCLPCADLVLNCSLCRPDGTCDECMDTYFLLPSTNLCYLECPLEYYGNLSSKICLSCRP